MDNSISMAQTQHSYFPYKADGSGYYGNNSVAGYLVAEESKSLLLAAIDAVPFRKEDGRPFTICDYGAADGTCTISVFDECIEYIRKKHGHDVEINIMYEDQPVNDFKSIFLRLHGLIPGRVPSYLAHHEGVFVSALGTGFYSQCCPSNTVHMGFTANAVHYLSRRPCSLTNALAVTNATNQEEIAQFAKQGAIDWETFLLHRTKELVPGGTLVIASLCMDKEGQFLGGTKAGGKPRIQVWTDLWRQMLVEGRITESEFQEMTLCYYFANEKELARPFSSEESPVWRSGLRLVSMETRIIPCPFTRQWEQAVDKESLSARQNHGRWLVGCMRNWANWAFLSALSDTRSEEERKEIVEEFFQRHEDNITRNPAKHIVDLLHAYIVIQKSGDQLHAD